MYCNVQDPWSVHIDVKGLLSIHDIYHYGPHVWRRTLILHINDSCYKHFNTELHIKGKTQTIDDH